MVSLILFIYYASFVILCMLHMWPCGHLAIRYFFTKTIQFKFSKSAISLSDGAVDNRKTSPRASSSYHFTRALSLLHHSTHYEILCFIFFHFVGTKSDSVIKSRPLLFQWIIVARKYLCLWCTIYAIELTHFDWYSHLCLAQ